MRERRRFRWIMVAAALWWSGGIGVALAQAPTTVAIACNPGPCAAANAVPPVPVSVVSGSPNDGGPSGGGSTDVLSRPPSVEESSPLPGLAVGCAGAALILTLASIAHRRRRSGLLPRPARPVPARPVPAPAAARKPAAPKPESVPTVADPERRWDIGAVERAASGNQRRR